MALMPYMSFMRAAAVKKQPVVLSRDTYRQQARVLKALANESRLMIIARLNQGECSVGELVTLVGSDQSTVSKHLAVLRAHGIVEDRREGTTVYYTLLTPCVLSFFSCASQVLEERRR
jgi:DNA-binding transcriptional ArsR family regulator